MTGRTRPDRGASAVGTCHQDVAAADLEERVVVHPAGVPAGSRTTASSSAIAPRTSPSTSFLRHIALDRGDLGRRDRLEARRATGAGRREQPAQRRHGSASPVSSPTRGGRRCRRRGGARAPGRRRTRCVVPRAAGRRAARSWWMPLGGRHLVDAVVAVAGGGVDGGRHQQVRVVVSAQRAHAQVGQSRDLADRQHARSVHPSPGGKSPVLEPSRRWTPQRGGHDDH